MRFRPRTDHNQREIVMGLRAIGASVLSLAGQGKGCPDLLVMFRGNLTLLEVKNPKQRKSDRQLTEQEKRFHLIWSEVTHIVQSIDEAFKAIGAL